MNIKKKCILFKICIHKSISVLLSSSSTYLAISDQLFINTVEDLNQMFLIAGKL